MLAVQGDMLGQSLIHIGVSAVITELSLSSYHDGMITALRPELY